MLGLLSPKERNCNGTFAKYDDQLIFSAAFILDR